MELFQPLERIVYRVILSPPMLNKRSKDLPFPLTDVTHISVNSGHREREKEEGRSRMVESPTTPFQSDSNSPIGATAKVMDCVSTVVSTARHARFHARVEMGALRTVSFEIWVVHSSPS